MKCPKCAGSMSEVPTKQGVVVDVCVKCQGMWFDEGELNFFIKDKATLAHYNLHGPKKPRPTPTSCPRCAKGKLRTGFWMDDELQLEDCPVCHGVYLDKGELKKIVHGSIAVESTTRKVADYLNPQKRPKTLPELPALGFASLMVFGSLYGFVFAALVFCQQMQWLTDFSAGLGVVIFILLQFFFGPFLTDLSLRWIGSMSWVSLDTLPPNVASFIVKTCKKNQIPVPKIGIIADGSPNAFTYGRTPYSARMVLSEGLMDLLDEEELKAVVAHELGHISHWDFVLMTMAQLVPVLLYALYRALERMNRSGRRKDGRLLPALIIAYIAYVVSQYIVLYLSRIREYWADRFAGEATGNPNSLISALVKIGYGLNRIGQELKTTEDQANTKEAISTMGRRAVGTLGILNLTGPTAQTMRFYGAQRMYGRGEIEEKDMPITEEIKEVMKWDMWNPWAWCYELQSTHPLIAKRINALAVQAEVKGVRPLIYFDLNKKESYGLFFLTDVFYLLLPMIGAIMAYAIAFNFDLSAIVKLYQSVKAGTPAPLHLNFLAAGFFAGYLLRLFYSYPNIPPLKFTVSSLLKMVKVSNVRGVGVKLKGTIIGRGIPGYLFSEDFVVRDHTGVIFLDYRQPVKLFELFFSIFRSKTFQGQEVEISGWYRRAPMPYVEVASIQTTRGDHATCYTYTVKVLFAILGIVASVMWGQF